jgi:hypothetical protein
VALHHNRGRPAQFGCYVESARRAIASPLTRLLLHLRTQIDLAIQESPSLRSYPAELLEDCYRRACRQAATQTKLEISTFPETCQYPLDLVLIDGWLPAA